MVRALLVRGLLVGVIAGLVAFGFARVFGEPQVERAVALEMQHSHDTAGSGGVEEPQLVSRGVQANFGLLAGTLLYGAGFGGLFALAYAFAQGRVDAADARFLAVFLALAGFLAMALAPSLKYPANPPGVGDHDTIGARSALFLIMLAVSVGAAALGIFVRQHLLPREDSWSAALAGAGVFVAIVALAMLLLPAADETPDGFPASLLWRFRLAALGTQFVMWTTLGLLFGWLTGRSLPQRTA